MATFHIASRATWKRSCLANVLRAYGFSEPNIIPFLTEGEKQFIGMKNIVAESTQLACSAFNAAKDAEAWGISIHLGIHEHVGRWFFGPFVAVREPAGHIHLSWGQDISVPRELFSQVKTEEQFDEAMKQWLSGDETDPFKHFSRGRRTIGEAVEFAIDSAFMQKPPTP